MVDRSKTSMLKTSPKKKSNPKETDILGPERYNGGNEQNWRHNSICITIIICCGKPRKMVKKLNMKVHQNQFAWVNQKPDLSFEINVQFHSQWTGTNITYYVMSFPQRRLTYFWANHGSSIETCNMNPDATCILLHYDGVFQNDSI